MQVILGEQQLTYENNISVISELFSHINKEAEANDRHISHLVVDGVAVYEDHAVYITNHVAKIEKIEVVLKTYQEFVNDLLLSAETYIEQALPEIQTLVDELYQGDSEATWGKFEQLLEGLQWLTQMIATVDQSSYQPSDWEQYMKLLGEIQENILEMEDALKNKDTIVLADIIQYEMTPLFEALQKQITETIDREGKRHDLN